MALDLRVDDDARPATWGECQRRGLGTTENPCPFVSCAMHLYLEVGDATGEVRLNFPDREPDELAATCALRVADAGGATLGVVGAALGLAREYARQIEARGLAALRAYRPTVRLADAFDIDTTEEQTAVAAPKRPDPAAARQRVLAAQQNAELARRMAPREPPASSDEPPEPAPDDEGVTTVETVTPAMARAWLEHNDDNRPLSQATVDQYTGDILARRWRVNHQGLAFGRAAGGVEPVYDGQHRLWAVVQADAPVRMRVTRGLPPEARPTIDQLRARTVADALRMGGRKREAKAVSWFRVIAAVAAKRPTKVSHAHVEAQLARYAPTVAWALAACPRTRPLNRVPVVAAFVFAHAAAPEPVAAFVAQYASGLGLEPGSPVHALREYVVRHVQTVRESEPRVFAKALRAVFAHVRGEPLEQLKESDAAWAWFAERQPTDGGP